MFAIQYVRLLYVINMYFRITKGNNYFLIKNRVVEKL